MVTGTVPPIGVIEIRPQNGTKEKPRTGFTTLEFTSFATSDRESDCFQLTRLRAKLLMTPRPFEKRPMPAERRNQIRHRTNIETLWVSITGQTPKGPVRIS